MERYIYHLYRSSHGSGIHGIHGLGSWDSFEKSPTTLYESKYWPSIPCRAFIFQFPIKFGSPAIESIVAWYIGLTGSLEDLEVCKYSREMEDEGWVCVFAIETSMVNWLFGARWFEILRIPLRIPIPFIKGSNQNPNHQTQTTKLTISWKLSSFVALDRPSA